MVQLISSKGDMSIGISANTLFDISMSRKKIKNLSGTVKNNIFSMNKKLIKKELIGLIFRIKIHVSPLELKNINFTIRK